MWPRLLLNAFAPHPGMTALLADHHCPSRQQAWICAHLFLYMCKRSLLCLPQPCHPGPRTPSACLARCPCALVLETSRTTQTTTMMVGCRKRAASLQLYELDLHPGSWPRRLAAGCKFGADCPQKAARASSGCELRHPLCRPVTPLIRSRDGSHQHNALQESP